MAYGTGPGIAAGLKDVLSFVGQQSALAEQKRHSQALETTATEHLALQKQQFVLAERQSAQQADLHKMKMRALDREEQKAKEQDVLMRSPVVYANEMFSDVVRDDAQVAHHVDKLREAGFDEKEVQVTPGKEGKPASIFISPRAVQHLQQVYQNDIDFVLKQGQLGIAQAKKDVTELSAKISEHTGSEKAIAKEQTMLDKARQRLNQLYSVQDDLMKEQEKRRLQTEEAKRHEAAQATAAEKTREFQAGESKLARESREGITKKLIEAKKPVTKSSWGWIGQTNGGKDAIFLDKTTGERRIVKDLEISKQMNPFLEDLKKEGAASADGGLTAKVIDLLRKIVPIGTPKAQQKREEIAKAHGLDPTRMAKPQAPAGDLEQELLSGEEED